MKKIITIIISACLMALGCFGLAACGNNNQNKNDKLSVVCTIFPEYDWVSEILGENKDNVDLTLLLDNGVDLHSYQPSVQDIAKISTCDLFIYVGGESDAWVDNALKNATNKNMKVINLLEVLGDKVKTEETVEGMEHEHEHSHKHEEIAEADIKDRTLADFAGEWKSLYPYLANGDLDEYLEHKAEEDGDETTTKETYREKYTASWACDADKITINGNSITFTYKDGKTQTATYSYAGYSPKRNDDGDISNVRYQFTTDSENAPKYIQFNDHGHEPGKAEHFHVYFGNDGFDSLMDSKTNPFFVKDSLSVEEILDELMGHEHEEENDEHVWLSLKNAEILCKKITSELSALDKDNAATYENNFAAYKQKLAALDKDYSSAVKNAKYKTLVFGDRFPFRYLVDDYNLKYYAAFAGCSAETEASFETIVFLAGKVDELSLPAVCTIEGREHKIAETVRDTTKAKNQKILTFDSMQSTTSKDIKNGVAYLSVMEKNLKVLKEALGVNA